MRFAAHSKTSPVLVASLLVLLAACGSDSVSATTEGSDTGGSSESGGESETGEPELIPRQFTLVHVYRASGIDQEMLAVDFEAPQIEQRSLGVSEEFLSWTFVPHPGQLWIGTREHGLSHVWVDADGEVVAEPLPPELPPHIFGARSLANGQALVEFKFNPEPFAHDGSLWWLQFDDDGQIDTGRWLASRPQTWKLAPGKQIVAWFTEVDDDYIPGFAELPAARGDEPQPRVELAPLPPVDPSKVWVADDKFVFVGDDDDGIYSPKLFVYDYADPSAPHGVYEFAFGTQYARWIEDQTKLVYVHNFAPTTLRYASFDNLVPSPATIVDTGELEPDLVPLELDESGRLRFRYGIQGSSSTKGIARCDFSGESPGEIEILAQAPEPGALVSIISRSGSDVIAYVSVDYATSRASLQLLRGTDTVELLHIDTSTFDLYEQFNPIPITMVEGERLLVFDRSTRRLGRVSVNADSPVLTMISTALPPGSHWRGARLSPSGTHVIAWTNVDPEIWTQTLLWRVPLAGGELEQVLSLERYAHPVATLSNVATP